MSQYWSEFSPVSNRQSGEQNTPSIAVLGSGALGLHYGTLIQKNTNCKVSYITSAADQINKQGLFVESVDGDYRIAHARAFKESSQAGQVDLVLVGLKTTAHKQTAELLKPLLHDKTIVVTLQNGMGNEASFGVSSNRIISGVAFLCCNRIASNKISHTAFGQIQLAKTPSLAIDLNMDDQESIVSLTEKTNSASPKLVEESIFRYIVNLFIQAGIKTDPSTYWSMRWQKLIWNIPFNGLCAIHDTGTQKIIEQPQTLNQVKNLMQEVIAAGAFFSKLAGEPLAEAFSAGFVEKQISATRSMGDYLPSMLLDARAGRELEINAMYELPLFLKRKLMGRQTGKHIEQIIQELKAMKL